LIRFGNRQIQSGLDWILGPHTRRDNPLSGSFPDECVFLFPLCHVVSHYENLTTFYSSGNCFSSPEETLLCKWVSVMKKRIRESVAQAKGPGLPRVKWQYLPLQRLLRGSSVVHMGLVQTDLRGSLLDTTMIDLMFAKQAP
jgi:hypothetical protein